MAIVGIHVSVFCVYRRNVLSPKCPVAVTSHRRIGVAETSCSRNVRRRIVLPDNYLVAESFPRRIIIAETSVAESASPKRPLPKIPHHLGTWDDSKFNRMLWDGPVSTHHPWRSPLAPSVLYRTKNQKYLSPLSILSGCLSSTARNLVGTHTQSTNDLHQVPVHAFLSFSLCPYSHVPNKRTPPPLIKNFQKI